MDEVRFERDLVLSLLKEQHPDLADLELREVVGGWDNQQWRLGEDLAVRLPRTERAPRLLRQEQQWLPLLASRVSLPVPVPVRVGEPSALFPHTWSVVRWVEGTPADREPITSPDSSQVLGRFLAALHINAPADAPQNPGRGVPLTENAGGFEHMFPLIEDHPLAETARGVWQAALEAPPWEGPALWVHGDLHPANVVVQEAALAGVIDFGDMSSGDPATDVSAAWLLLPDGAAVECLEAYDRADEATITRARGWATFRALSLIMIGRNGRLGLPGGKPTWEPAGYATLNRLAAS